MITWALANWTKVIIGILILSITIYIGFLKLQNAALRSEADSLERQVQASKEEFRQWEKLYTILGDQLAEQNKSIENLKYRTEQAKKARRTADKKAAPIVTQAREREKAVSAVPVANEATCEAEMATINALLEAAK